MPKWARDYLLLPLAVGLVVAIFTFGLPKLFADKLELSYEIDRPIRVLDDPAIRQVKIEVNGTPVSDLFAFRVRLWNSGNKPISDLPVRLVFDAETSEFSILNTTHQTTPPYEFGKIDELEATPLTRRYRYELLNPGDGDVITLLTNGASRLDLYAKAESLKVTRREATDAGETFRKLTNLAQIIAVVLAIAASFLSMIFRTLQDKTLQRLRVAIKPRKRNHVG